MQSVKAGFLYSWILLMAKQYKYFLFGMGLGYLTPKVFLIVCRSGANSATTSLESSNVVCSASKIIAEV